MKDFNWKEDDDIVMVLDLTNNTMKYTINGKSVTIRNQKAPRGAYKLVVCNIGHGTEVELVSYSNNN